MKNQKLIIFHAGSLAVPFKQICEEFNKLDPNVQIAREAAGIRTCARKISDLQRPCDIMASADYSVIDSLLIPKHVSWNIIFASNEMVIAFRPDSTQTHKINKNNWYRILLKKAVTFGRSDPNCDPCVYRSVFRMVLAEKFYKKPGLAKKFLAKDTRYIRPKEVDLLALLEVGELDYIFIYRSVAEQHKLKYLVLPDQVNLKSAEFADLYKSAAVQLTGKKPGTFITKTGSPILYGVTIPNNAPNPKLVRAFLIFLLNRNQGGAILERNSQTFVVPSPTKTFGKFPAELKIFTTPPENDKDDQAVTNPG